jgi:hypothetical protein
MFPRTNKRKAISAVLTTIIILVASIVLGTGVVVYSTSLFQTGGQQQAVTVQGIKAWVNTTSQTAGQSQYAGWGAAAVRNSGDKLISINTIQIRGVTVPYINWYADTNTTRAAQNYQAQLNLTRTDMNLNAIGSFGTGGQITAGISASCIQYMNTQRQASPLQGLVIDEDGAGSNLPLCLTLQSGPIGLAPGNAAIIYFKLPANVVGPLDSGQVATVSIFAGNVGAPQTIRISNPQ